jgi:hypothetical protein
MALSCGSPIVLTYFCVYSTSMRDYSVTAWLDRHQEVHLDFKELTKGRFIIK